VALRPDRFELLAAAVIVGTAGWFFFYAIFALAIRRNDAFNTVTSIFYFVFLFASSMFYPIDRCQPPFAPSPWPTRLRGTWTSSGSPPSDWAIHGGSRSRRQDSWPSRRSRSSAPS
jgi:hypothetical protein